jgi:hypothetical protein
MQTATPSVPLPIKIGRKQKGNQGGTAKGISPIVEMYDFLFTGGRPLSDYIWSVR